MTLNFEIDDKYINSVKQAYGNMLLLAENKAPRDDIAKSEKTYKMSIKVIISAIEEQIEREVLGDDL